MGSFQAGIRFIQFVRHPWKLLKSPADGEPEVAQVSEPAVSPTSKPAEAANAGHVEIFGRSQVWKPALQQTRRSALQIAMPCAAPAPVFRPGAQAGLHRIIPDISCDATVLLFISNPMVVRFPLPKRFLPEAKNLFGLSRRILFPGFKHVRKQVIRHRVRLKVSVNFRNF